MDDQPEKPSRSVSRRLGVGLIAGALVAAGGAWVVASIAGSDEPPGAAAPPVFAKEAASSGIDHVYDGEFTFFVGGGVAVFDCNDDRKPDLFFAGGVNPASLYRNDSAVGGELRFTKIGEPGTELTEVVGAYPIDIDSDSQADLVVLRLGENVLLRGLGDCRFERANEEWSFDGGEAWTAGFSAKWEGSAAFPTLAFGNYLALDDAGNQTGTCADNQLFRPESAGYPTAGTLTPGWCTLSILFSDWDRSGRGDLRIANDRHYYRDGEEQLWRVETGREPRLYTHDEGWKPMQIWGMGIATYDVTGDGMPEVFLSSQGDNKLQTLEDGAIGPSYVDIAIRRGVTAHRPFIGDETLPSTAWHPEFQDVNNDGYIDLYISKGNVEATDGYAIDDPNNLLLGQPDGTFVEGAFDAGVASFSRSRGAAVVDLNLDGLLDLVQVNRRENVDVWRSVGSNQTDDGHWLAVQLRQTGSNAHAVGSWIEVRMDDRTLERELTVGGGHAGGQLGWIHFGLGPARTVELRVHWPDGETGPWLTADANAFVIIDRGAARPQFWDPAAGS